MGTPRSKFSGVAPRKWGRRQKGSSPSSLAGDSAPVPYVDNVEDKLLKILARWRNQDDKKPYGFENFIEEALGIDGTRGFAMSTQQREGAREISKIVRAKWRKWKNYPLTDEDREYLPKIGVSIMSGQGPGKDAILAWFIIWFLFCYDQVLIPCTAPGADQLKNILWAEVSRWLNRQDDKGYICADWIRENISIQGDKIYKTESLGKVNFAFPKTANPKDDPEAQAKTLYGYHSPYMAIIIDEAAGVAEPVFKPLEGTLTGELNIILMAFNPIYRTGYAVESHTGPFSHKWVLLQWDAEESEIVSKESIATKEEMWGRNSNSFRTLVKGLPPLSESDTLIPYDWVQDAAKREVIPAEEEPHIGGVDCGGGGDNSVYTHRHGLKVFKQLAYSSPNSLEVGAWAVQRALVDDLDALYFDVIGIGNGAYYEAKRLLHGTKCKVYAVDVRNRARDDEKYPNKRSELWFKARGFFQDGVIQIPDDQTLKEELWSPKRKPTARREEVESKYDMKKRLAQNRSPNNADSLLLTFDKPDLIFRHDKKEVAEDRWRTKKRMEEQTSWMAA